MPDPISLYLEFLDSGQPICVEANTTEQIDTGLLSLLGIELLTDLALRTIDKQTLLEFFIDYLERTDTEAAANLASRINYAKGQ